MFGVLANADQGDTGMVRPAARYRSAPIGRVIVLEHGRNPSTDVYLKPRLSLAGTPPVDYVDMASSAPEAFDFRAPGGAGAFVIVCRYITGKWMRRLAASKNHLSGLAYFTDDDLSVAARDSALPGRYRRKIDRLYGRHVGGLSSIADRLWVSSRSLAAKYADHGAELVQPVFVSGPNGRTPHGAAQGDACKDRPLRYFYHGTSAHRRELRWLVEVVAEVQRRRSDTVFEVLGSWSVRRLFRGIERVNVVHPMGWPDYLAHSAVSRHGVGLAPLLPSAFNTARSPSKFYDIARSGSVGLYSNTQPYDGFVRDGVDGVLLANQPAHWVEAILAFADDPDRRSGFARAARARSLAEARNISPLPIVLGADSRPASPARIGFAAGGSD